MKVTIENLTLHYEGNTVVSELDLEIADGESLVLLGQSGCGKTSTMRCIAGLERPAAAGSPSATPSSTTPNGRIVAPYKRNVGMVFQSYAVWPHRTVFENVGFSLKMKKVPKEEPPTGPQGARPRRAARFRDRGASHSRRADAACRAGPQPRHAAQRAAARRTAVQPRRPATRTAPHGAPGDPARPDLTTVYVTHDQIEAFALADRIALMQDGRIVQIGTRRRSTPPRRLDRRLPRRRQHLPLHARPERHDAAVRPPGSLWSATMRQAQPDQTSACGPRICWSAASMNRTGGQSWPGRVDVASFQGATVRYRITLEDGPVVEAIATAASRCSAPATAYRPARPSAAQVLPETASPNGCRHERRHHRPASADTPPPCTSRLLHPAPGSTAMSRSLQLIILAVIVLFPVSSSSWAPSPTTPAALAGRLGTSRSATSRSSLDHRASRRCSTRPRRARRLDRGAGHRLRDGVPRRPHQRPRPQLIYFFGIAPLFLPALVGALAWAQLGSPASGFINVVARAVGMPNLSTSTASAG